MFFTMQFVNIMKALRVAAQTLRPHAERPEGPINLGGPALRALPQHGVMDMADSSIDLVRQEEAQAETVAREAAAKAAAIVDEAHDKAVKQAADAEDTARAAAVDKLAGAHTASQKTLDEALNSLSGEMEALENKARAAQPKAVEMILKALA